MKSLILEVVARELAIPVSDICGRSRFQEYVDARAIAIAAWVRYCPDMPARHMAMALCRDKSCVHNLRRTFRARLLGREGFRRKWRLVKAALAEVADAG